jgi:hypothetical protein
MKSLLGTLALVAAITGGIVFFVLRDEAATSKRLSAEAEAIGFVATPAKWYEDEENVEGHTLTFSFVDAANGVHARTMERITWYDPERGYKVCYNPEEPEDFRLYRADHVCGS